MINLFLIEQKNIFEKDAKDQGFHKVSQHKMAVVHKIQEYTAGGGFLFAMCSATDTYDIALSAHKTDICEYMFDGDPIEKNAQDKLTFIETFAFENFENSNVLTVSAQTGAKFGIWRSP